MFSMHPIDLSSLVFVVKDYIASKFGQNVKKYMIINNEKHKYYSFKHLFVTMVTEIKIHLSHL